MAKSFDNNSNELRFSRPGDIFVCRAAALIIRDKKLLAASSRDIPGLYFAIGGTVNIHETSEEAVIREVKEEIGIRLEVEQLAFVNEEFFILNGKKIHQMTFCYLMKAELPLDIAEGSFTDQGEKETLHWLPLDNLNEYNLVPTFLKSRRLDGITAVEHVIIKEY